MSAPPLVLAAAIARNGIIGGGNRLLWRLPSDLRRFREITWGKPMIMGRKTFEAIGRPLPGRESIVLTRDPDFFAPAGAHSAHTLAAALDLAAERAQAMAADEIIVAGGGEIYAALIGRAARLQVTEVDLAPAGDARFPAIDPAVWRETFRAGQDRGPGDEADFAFVQYERRGGGLDSPAGRAT